MSAIEAIIRRCRDSGLTESQIADFLEDVNGGKPRERQIGGGVLVYIFQVVGVDIVKIGVSDNPWYRLVAIQGCNPYELRLVQATDPRPRHEAMTIERLAHEKLKDKRIRGEWFACSPDEAMDVVNELEEAAYGSN